jgi:quercetin dioxygenase-like cupin family protein
MTEEVLENPVTGECLRILESTPERFRAQYSLKPHSEIPGAHFHPGKQQSVTVVSGEMHLRINGSHHVVRAGESLTIPTGGHHFQWNPCDTELVAIEEVFPAGTAARVLLGPVPACRRWPHRFAGVSVPSSGRCAVRGISGLDPAGVFRAAASAGCSGARRLGPGVSAAARAIPAGPAGKALSDQSPWCPPVCGVSARTGLRPRRRPKAPLWGAFRKPVHGDRSLREIDKAS